MGLDQEFHLLSVIVKDWVVKRLREKSTCSEDGSEVTRLWFYVLSCKQTYNLQTWQMMRKKFIFAFLINQRIPTLYAWKYASSLGIRWAFISPRPFTIAQTLSLPLNSDILGRLLSLSELHHLIILWLTVSLSLSLISNLQQTSY